jgi:hypothetical protein
LTLSDNQDKDGPFQEIPVASPAIGFGFLIVLLLAFLFLSCGIVIAVFYNWIMSSIEGIRPAG